MRSERKTEGRNLMMLEFVTLSLFLSLPIYLYCRKYSFPIRTGDLFKAYVTGRTSALLGHWWADRKLRRDGARRHHEAPGAAEVVPFSGPPPSGTQPTASLPAAGPRLLPAPAPSRPCFSPFPRGLCWLLPTVHSEGQLQWWETRLQGYTKHSQRAGSKFRKAPPSGERGKLGSASRRKDIRWCR